MPLSLAVQAITAAVTAIMMATMGRGDGCVLCHIFYATTRQALHFMPRAGSKRGCRPFQPSRRVLAITRVLCNHIYVLSDCRDVDADYCNDRSPQRRAWGVVWSGELPRGLGRHLHSTDITHGCSGLACLRLRGWPKTSPRATLRRHVMDAVRTGVPLTCRLVWCAAAQFPGI